MIDAILTVVSFEESDQVQIKGYASDPQLWGMLAAAVLKSVVEKIPEEERKDFFEVICDAVKDLVFGEEKEVTPDDVQGETRAPEETEGDPEA